MGAKRDETVEEIVDFITSYRSDQADEVTQHAFRQRFVDTVACAIGGYDADAAQIGRSVAADMPAVGLGATLWGEGRRVGLSDAAFANGIAARYLDFNDTYRSAIDVCHPSDAIPALFACAEATDASGLQLRDAVIIAYEVHCRFIDSIPFNDLGWDQPTSGVVAAAAGASRLFDLTPSQIREALSLAIVPNYASQQTRAGELSMWKGCAAAMGAGQGVRAAVLAKHGMMGPEQPFVGKYGMWNLLGRTPSELGLGKGAPTWGIQQSNIKTYPVRDSCQLAIRTALDLRGQLGGEEIAELRVETYKSSYMGAAADPELWAPATRHTADHSLPVSTAVAILDGDVTPMSYEKARFADADVLALISKMTVEISSEFSQQTPGRRNMRMTAKTSSGRVVQAHTTLTQAEIEAGIADDVLNDKARKLLSAHFDGARSEAIISSLWEIEAAPTVGGVVSLLKFA